MDYEKLKNEPFETKPYFRSMTLRDARTKFSIDSSTLPTVKVHFSSDRQYAAELWSCIPCGRVDSISHLKVCSQYDDLREGKDLYCDRDLVKFFQQVIKRRTDTDPNIGP